MCFGNSREAVFILSTRCLQSITDSAKIELSRPVLLGCQIVSGRTLIIYRPFPNISILLLQVHQNYFRFSRTAVRNIYKYIDV